MHINRPVSSPSSPSIQPKTAPPKPPVESGPKVSSPISSSFKAPTTTPSSTVAKLTSSSSLRQLFNQIDDSARTGLLKRLDILKIAPKIQQTDFYKSLKTHFNDASKTQLLTMDTKQRHSLIESKTAKGAMSSVTKLKATIGKEQQKFQGKIDQIIGKEIQLLHNFLDTEHDQVIPFNLVELAQNAESPEKLLALLKSDRIQSALVDFPEPLEDAIDKLEGLIKDNQKKMGYAYNEQIKVIRQNFERSQDFVNTVLNNEGGFMDMFSASEKAVLRQSAADLSKLVRLQEKMLITLEANEHKSPEDKVKALCDVFSDDAFAAVFKPQQLMVTGMAVEKIMLKHADQVEKWVDKNPLLHQGRGYGNKDVSNVFSGAGMEGRVGTFLTQMSTRMSMPFTEVVKLAGNLGETKDKLPQISKAAEKLFTASSRLNETLRIVELGGFPPVKGISQDALTTSVVEPRFKEALSETVPKKSTKAFELNDYLTDSKLQQGFIDSLAKEFAHYEASFLIELVNLNKTPEKVNIASLQALDEKYLAKGKAPLEINCNETVRAAFSDALKTGNLDQALSLLPEIVKEAKVTATDGYIRFMSTEDYTQSHIDYLKDDLRASDLSKAYLENPAFKKGMHDFSIKEWSSENLDCLEAIDKMASNPDGVTLDDLKTFFSQFIYDPDMEKDSYKDSPLDSSLAPQKGVININIPGTTYKAMREGLQEAMREGGQKEDMLRAMTIVISDLKTNISDTYARYSLEKGAIIVA